LSSTLANPCFGHEPKAKVVTPTNTHGRIKAKDHYVHLSMYTLYMDMKRCTLILTFGINNDKLKQGTMQEKKRKNKKQEHFSMPLF